jgi:phage gp36-like protein
VEKAIGADKLAQISDYTVPATTIDPVVVVRALGEASALADTYLTAYLPITTVPDVLRRAVVDISIHRMRSGRDLSTEDSRRAYDEAIQWLRDVSMGKASLGLPESPELSVTAPEFMVQPRLWTRDTGRRVF